MAGLFNTRLLERGDREFRREGWATSARDLPPVGQPIFRARSEDGESVLAELDDVLLEVNLYSGSVFVEAAAGSTASIDPSLVRRRAHFPTHDPESGYARCATCRPCTPH